MYFYLLTCYIRDRKCVKCKGAVRLTRLPSTQPLQRRSASDMRSRNDRYPIPGGGHFLLWNESISTTNVANEIISVNAWNTSMASPPFREISRPPSQAVLCARIIIPNTRSLTSSCRGTLHFSEGQDNVGCR